MQILKSLPISLKDARMLLSHLLGLKPNVDIFDAFSEQCLGYQYNVLYMLYGHGNDRSLIAKLALII